MMTLHSDMSSLDCMLPTLLSQAEDVSDRYPVEFELQGKKEFAYTYGTF